MSGAGTATVEAILGDIVKERVDAIVNAANSGLLGGAGVDGAIHAAAGPALLAECRALVARIGSCAPGDAVITGSGALPCRYVIHTVGPVWRGGSRGEAAILESAYRRCLELAAENGCSSIAFPNVATGAYGFPKALAASIVAAAMRRELPRFPSIALVRFVCFDRENFELYSRACGTVGGPR
jgi:O-acetyl-ADP-ribose deacetylase (regulator of RNase III)